MPESPWPTNMRGALSLVSDLAVNARQPEGAPLSDEERRHGAENLRDAMEHRRQLHGYWAPKSGSRAKSTTLKVDSPAGELVTVTNFKLPEKHADEEQAAYETRICGRKGEHDARSMSCRILTHQLRAPGMSVRTPAYEEERKRLASEMPPRDPVVDKDPLDAAEGELAKKYGWPGWYEVYVLVRVDDGAIMYVGSGKDEPEYLCSSGVVVVSFAANDWCLKKMGLIKRREMVYRTYDEANMDEMRYIRWLVENDAGFLANTFNRNLYEDCNLTPRIPKPGKDAPPTVPECAADYVTHKVLRDVGFLQEAARALATNKSISLEKAALLIQTDTVVTRDDGTEIPAGLALLRLREKHSRVPQILQGAWAEHVQDACKMPVWLDGNAQRVARWGGTPDGTRDKRQLRATFRNSYVGMLAIPTAQNRALTPADLEQCIASARQDGEVELAEAAEADFKANSRNVTTSGTLGAYVWSSPGNAYTIGLLFMAYLPDLRAPGGGLQVQGVQGGAGGAGGGLQVEGVQGGAGGAGVSTGVPVRRSVRKKACLLEPPAPSLLDPQTVKGFLAMRHELWTCKQERRNEGRESVTEEDLMFDEVLSDAE